FDGPVTVEAEGLPQGVIVSPLPIGPRVEQAPVVFSAAPDANEWSGTIRLRAWADLGKKRVEREVACSQRRWGESVNGQPNQDNAARICREIGLAVRSKAPYGLILTADPPAPTVRAGGTLSAKLTVRRNWPEFQGAIQLTGLFLPPGFECANVEVPA